MSKPDGVMHRGAGVQRHNPTAVALRKVEEAEAPIKPRHFTVESIHSIQEYRCSKELTQRQLDHACSFPAGTINLLEGRRIEPTRVQLQKLNNLVGKGLILS